MCYMHALLAFMHAQTIYDRELMDTLNLSYYHAGNTVPMIQDDSLYARAYIYSYN